jgi:hypothetical protein
MKPLQHHLHRLAKHMLDAETVSTREDAQRVIRKAEKHQKKISRWHKLFDRVVSSFNSHTKDG